MTRGGGLVEFKLGSQASSQDLAQDPDNDRLPTGDELMMHTDPLRVDAENLSVTGYRYEVVKQGGLQPDGRQCWTFRIANVALVDKVIEGASNTFRVRLSLPNPGNVLPAGLRCKAELPGSEPPAAPRPVSRSTSPPQLSPQLTPSLRLTPRV